MRLVTPFEVRNEDLAVICGRYFGVPDTQFGEIVATWIVSKPDVVLTDEEVCEFCRDSIDHYKVPALMRFESELPMTVTGKPQKFLMRNAMI